MDEMSRNKDTLKFEKEVTDSMNIDTPIRLDSNNTTLEQSRILERNSDIAMRAVGSNSEDDENVLSVLQKDTWHLSVDGSCFDKENNANPNVSHFKAGDLRLLHRHNESESKATFLGEQVKAHGQTHQPHPERTLARILLDESYRPLTSFSNAHELVSAMLGTIQAHSAAYTQAGMLHGNVGVHTIVVGKEGQGYLIDWDISQLYRPHNYYSAQFGILARQLLLCGAEPDFGELVTDRDEHCVE